jgi:hypothetical protein
MADRGTVRVVLSRHMYTLLRFETILEELYSLLNVCMFTFEIQVSGLSADIGAFLSFLESWPHWCLLLMLAVIANVSSTFVGLNATSTILLPIVAELVRIYLNTFSYRIIK